MLGGVRLALGSLFAGYGVSAAYNLWFAEHHGEVMDRGEVLFMGWTGAAGLIAGVSLLVLVFRRS
jgi:hypothetical protein